MAGAPFETRRLGSARGYRIPIFVSTVAMLIVVLFFWRLRVGAPLPSIWIYWGALALTLIPGLVSRNRMATGYSVGLFVFVQCFSYALSSPYGFVYYTDPISNLQSARILASNHFWQTGVGTGPAFAYSFYPGQSFFQVALSFVSGLPLTVTYLYGTDLVRFIVVPLAIYKILRRFIGEKPSLAAVAIFFAVPSYIFNLPVEQEYAYIFLVLGLQAALLAPWAKTRYALSLPTFVAALIFLGSVAISHYFTAYVSAGFLLILAFGSLRLRTDRRASSGDQHLRNPASRALLAFRYGAPAFAYIFVLWSLYVSNSIDLGWAKYGGQAFSDALSPGSSLGGTGGGSYHGVRSGYTYSSLEIAVIGGALVLVLASAVIGISLLIGAARRRPAGARPAVRVLLTLSLVGFILFFITAPLVLSNGLYVPLRVLEFAGLGIFPFSGFLLAYLHSRWRMAATPVIVVCVAIIVVGGGLVQVSNPRFDYLPSNVQYCEMPPHLTPDVLAAVDWADVHLNKTGFSIFGDELMHDSFQDYGGFQLSANTPAIYSLFASANVTQELLGSARVRIGDIVLTDSFMTRSICFEGYRTTPFAPASVLKFGASQQFQELFNNTDVQIYRYTGP